MWRFVRAQLAYRRGWLLAALVAALGFASVPSLVDRSDDQLVSLLSGMLGAVTVVLGMALWSSDAKEARTLLWLPLPIAPATWLWTRLVIQGSVVVGVTAVGLVGWAARSVLHGDADLDAWLLGVGGGQSVALLLLLLVLFSEELNIAVRRSTVGLWIANLGAGGVAAAGAFFGLQGSPTWWGIAIVLAACLLFVLVTAWLYHRRDNYLIGTSPIHGLPRDLSQEGSISLR